jgi:hypothetical protein
MNNYEQAWSERRKLRNQFFLIYLAYVPVVFVIAFITVRLFHTLIVGFVAAFAWMIVWIVSWIRFIAFPCPRCGKPFLLNWRKPHQWPRYCLHCGLQKYSRE